jgi:hypothetical protein
MRTLRNGRGLTGWELVVGVGAVLLIAMMPMWWQTAQPRAEEPAVDALPTVDVRMPLLTDAGLDHDLLAGMYLTGEQAQAVFASVDGWLEGNRSTYSALRGELDRAEAALRLGLLQVQGTGNSPSRSLSSLRSAVESARQNLEAALAPVAAAALSTSSSAAQLRRTRARNSAVASIPLRYLGLAAPAAEQVAAERLRLQQAIDVAEDEAAIVQLGVSHRGRVAAIIGAQFAEYEVELATLGARVQQVLNADQAAQSDVAVGS